MPLYTSTPLIESHALGQASGQNIWLKLDALQPCGSFKLRGIGHACETLAGQGKKRFVASSGGNAGIAVAYAGRQLSMPVTVVVPQTTTEHARALIRAQGADAASFLHGQLTQDVQQLGPHSARLAGYCTAKGRLLASLIGWRAGADELLLACSADVLAATLKRLSMFVLRAKAKVTDVSDAWATYALLGESTDVLHYAGLSAPGAPWACPGCRASRSVRGA